MKKKENPKKSNTTGTITERGVENKSKTGIGRIIRGEKGEKLKGGLLTYIILITYAVLLYLLVSNIGTVKNYLKLLIQVLSPIIMGLVFAYVLNIPMRFFERVFYKKLELSKRALVRKLKRPLAIVTTYVAVALVLTILVLFFGPQITDSIVNLVSNMNNYISSLNNFINDLTQRFDLSSELWKTITINWNEIITKGSELISATLPQVYNLTKSLTSGIINIVMGIIVSVYVLAKKEKLIRIMKQLIFAYTSKCTANRILDTGAQFNKSFQKFISGQITEAFILGVLVLIGMLIFNFPYAVLCSGIIAVTAIIPFFGAWLGAIPSAFIILMVDPPKVIWFIIFIIVLQQLEGNIIYPKVMGNSIGLDGLWVLVSLIVGGSLFGIGGMIVGIPAFAVIYAILARVTKRRLKERGIEIE
ncbi:MAG: AI-2E family transporter [Acetivibrionales bacterium]|jgi:predicted PurR-regulated permease PerM|nr:AI-2E family transporter [Clostridiaceae bacterium]